MCEPIRHCVVDPHNDTTNISHRICYVKGQFSTYPSIHIHTSKYIHGIDKYTHAHIMYVATTARITCIHVYAYKSTRSICLLFLEIVLILGHFGAEIPYMHTCVQVSMCPCARYPCVRILLFLEFWNFRKSGRASIKTPRACTHIHTRARPPLLS